jgi:hypothetical protein
MELIRNLGVRGYSNQRKMCSLFLYPICGKKVERRKQHGLLQKHCGCNKHGLSKTPEYKLWAGIKRRCYNHSEEKYKNYGERGIRVCEEWKTNPINFISWCGKNRYKKGLQIDRVDNNGDYSPSNCEFVTQLVNSRHRSDTILTLDKANEIRERYLGSNTKYSDIGRLYNIDPSLIRQVLLNKIWKNYEN